MTHLINQLIRLQGKFEDYFEYTVEDCEAAKFFLNKLKEKGENLGVALERISGYEIVTLANQKLKEVIG